MSAAEEWVIDALRDAEDQAKSKAYRAWAAAHNEVDDMVGRVVSDNLRDAVWSFMDAVENAASRRVRTRHDDVVCALRAAKLPPDLEERYLDTLGDLEDDVAEMGRRHRAAAAVAVSMVEGGPKRVLCAHADRNGEGAHWKHEGEACHVADEERIIRIEAQVTRIEEKVARVMAARAARRKADSARITVPAELVEKGRRLVGDGEILSDELVAWLDGWDKLDKALVALYGGDVPEAAYVISGADVLWALAMRMQWRVNRATASQEYDTLDEHDRQVASALAKWKAATT